MVKIITAQDLKKKLDAKEDFVLVMVLGEEYFKQKHISGSMNIPSDHVSEKAEELLPDKNKEIVVYCANTACQASPTAAKKLEALGYTNIVDFEDGIEGWEKAGYKFEGTEA